MLGIRPVRSTRVPSNDGGRSWHAPTSRLVENDAASRKRGFWLSSCAAVLAGLLLDAGFPGLNAWPLTLAGVALLLGLLEHAGIRRGSWLGLLSGLAFYLAHVSWTSEYLGPVPWIALSVLEALLFAAGAASISAARKFIEKVWPTPSASFVLYPVAVGGLWVLREAVAGSWPYGGFAWGRLAYSQSESPLGPLVAWVGVPGLSFLLVWAIAVVLATHRVTSSVTGAVTATVLLALGAAIVPAWETPSSGEVRVAAVQGDGPAGYFDARGPGDLLAAQVRATAPVIGEEVDVVIWPENSMDEDPLVSAATAATLRDMAERLGAPLLVGAVNERAGRLYNSSIAWSPEGVEGIYDKAHPVPFGEYVPDREFWSLLAPSLIGLIQRDYEVGRLPPVLQLDGLRAGVSICFDIVDDALIDQMMNEKAQVIFAQTNNADFGRTDESAQQLAITKIRAIQTGRSIVTVSTVGQSQTILPDGTTSQRLAAFKPGVIMDSVPLASEDTPATLIGDGIYLLIASLTVAAALATTMDHTARSGVRRSKGAR
ncbi:apolipoprotein N-acyltransferase (plasmid) [Rathayibacter sp. VKM Ac-2759]|nr:apolipoprotein N-acyltransferase [Rathayibacter sp. VKM Ac-2759]QHC68824.1 apolipoprotein N-acyltransferase [Rathayibacter sp. VKM Ac-2759]